MKKFFKILLRAFATLLALLLCLLLVLFVIPLTETGDKAVVDGSADWMADLPNDIPLNRIDLPGTHDSGTQYVQLAFFSKCQSKGVGEQLEAGFRYLDIRLGVNAHHDIFQLMHGFTDCKWGGPMPWNDPLYLDVVLDECYEFLKSHPTETVVFAVKQEHGEESVAQFEEMLAAYIQEDPEYWLLTDTIPSLGEARGKLVLLRRYEDAAGLGAAAGIPFLWDNQNGHEDVSLNAAVCDNGSYRLWVQDRYEYGAADKWNAFLEGIAAYNADGGEGDIALSFLSTKGTAAYGHPYRYAKTLNPKLLHTEPGEGERWGWVVVDFASAPLAEHIYRANFK